MQVIKVVHTDDVNCSSSIEEQRFSISKYDPDEFIVENGKWLYDYLINQSNSLGKAFFLGPIAGLNEGKNRGESRRRLILNRISKEVVGHISNGIIDDINKKISLAKIITFDEAKKFYPRTKGLSVGTYTLHPYDEKQLARLENFHKNLALEKDDELVNILGQMGASLVRITESHSKTESSSVNIEAKIRSFKGNLESGLSTSSASSSDVIREVKFKGDFIDIDPHLLETSFWFANDSLVNSILKSRVFNQNRIEEYTIKNTYTETFDFDFSLAAKFLPTKIDLIAEYDYIRRTERHFHVKF